MLTWTLLVRQKASLPEMHSAWPGKLFHRPDTPSRSHTLTLHRPVSVSTKWMTPPSGMLLLYYSLTTTKRFRRDDPNIDETTRLRNRIAELESLVRELRGTRTISL